MRVELPHLLVVRKVITPEDWSTEASGEKPGIKSTPQANSIDQIHRQERRSTKEMTMDAILSLQDLSVAAGNVGDAGQLEQNAAISSLSFFCL